MLSALIATALAPACLVSWGKSDITPPEDLPMGGYTARGDTKGSAGTEKLYARCSLVQKGDFKLAIVSAEMLTIPESLEAAVRAQIPADVNLVLGATHTHCAPDSQMLNSRMTFKVPGIAGYSGQWSEWYATRIADSVKQALAAEAKPSAFRLSLGEADASRARREDGGTDPRVWLLSGDGGTILASFSAHATLYDEKRMTWSGDWPGQWMETMRGPFLPGAIGDQSPVAEGETTEEKIKNMCNSLSFSFLNADREELELTDVGYVRQPIKLDPPKPHPEFAKSFGAPDVLAAVLVGKFAPPEAVVTAVRLDGLAIIGIPGEPTVAVAEEIRKAASDQGYSRTLILSHINGWIGYILQPEDYAKGGYEATLSFNGPETSVRVVEAAKEALRKLKPAVLAQAG